MTSKGKDSGSKEPETTRICVLGPSFCGKTQIVNRLVNNQFYPQYIPTDELEIYKIFFNKAKPNSPADPVKIEIMDCFPQDHQLLFTDGSTSDSAKDIQDTLQKVIKNIAPGSSVDKPEKWIHAFIFVYDASNRDSFKKLIKMIATVTEFEKSNALGAKDDEEDNSKVMKYVLGTKKDIKPHKKVLEQEDLQALQEQDLNGCISLQEVSALTNYGIQEVFDNILVEVVSAQKDASSGGQESKIQRLQSDDEEEDDEDYDEEYDQEEVKEPTAGGDSAGLKGRFQMADTAPQDFMSRQYNKRARKMNMDDYDNSDTRQKGGTTTAGGDEEGVSSKGIFQTFMPFLFQTPKEELKTRGRRK